MSDSKVKGLWKTTTAPLRGNAVREFEIEDATERMIRPPVMAEGTEVGLAPSTHFVARPVTASGMISPRTPAVNPLTDASLGFVDSRLDELLGTTPDLARGSSNQMPPIVRAARASVFDQTPLVRSLPRQRGSWLVRFAAFALASGIGFAVAYFATALR